MNTKNKRAKEAIRKITGHISFGELLFSYRQGHELTQVEMAKILKITKQELCNIEKGRKFISIERAVQFAKSLKHSPNVFAKYILQDQLHRAGLTGKIEIKEVA